MAHGKTATMDFCVEIKILLVKNEGETVEKTNQREKEKRELIAIQQKLKSENQGIKKKKILSILYIKKYGKITGTNLEIIGRELPT